MNAVISKCDLVIQGLENKIKNGQYQSGDQIPIEPEIVKEYGVGRNTVREAISTLVHKGMLEKIQGKGTFVRENNSSHLPQKELAHSMTLKELSQLYDVRSALEGLACRLACENLTDSEIEKLKKIVCKYKAGVKSRNITVLEEADLDFHKKIISLSENVFLKKELDEFSVLERFFLLEKNLLDSRKDYILVASSDDPWSHDAIIEAMIAGDKDKCEQIMRQHIQRAKVRLLERSMDISLNPF